jgi:glucose-1-phosphate thymidylyltransferase
MKIIVPMAGWGSRLRPHTLTVPKPMLKVAGKSIVERLISNIAGTIASPIESISFIIREDFGKKIEADLHEIAKKYNTTGHICYQSEPLGTAHAIYCAADHLDGEVIVGFADTMFQADFKIDNANDAIIWVKEIEDPSAFGVVSLDDNGLINGFVEKPKEYVSNLAIIGIYYFKDGVQLRADIKEIIDNNITDKGEFQLTTVLENMRLAQKKMKPGTVSQWLDCGNKNATVDSNREVLKATGNQIHASVVLENATIIEPCFIDENTVIKNAVVGPFVSIGKGSSVAHSVISNAIIQDASKIENYILSNTMVGSNALLVGRPQDLSVGDYNQILS